MKMIIGNYTLVGVNDDGDSYLFANTSDIDKGDTNGESFVYNTTTKEKSTPMFLQTWFKWMTFRDPTVEDLKAVQPFQKEIVS